MLEPQFKSEWGANDNEKAALKAELTAKACAGVDVALPDESPVHPPQKKKKKSSVSWTNRTCQP